VLEIGWFSTGRDPAARDLLTTVVGFIQRGELAARVQFAFSNREPGEAEESDIFFDLVRSYEIPLVTFSSRRFRRSVGGDFGTHREEYDQEVMARIAHFNPDVVVLAGYMLYTAAEMCNRYTIINLHPALPDGPTGTWQQVIWQLIKTKADRTGAMIHLATKDWDRGPPVTYCAFSIRGEPFDPLWKEINGRSVEELKENYGEELPLFRTIRKHGMVRESPLLLATLKALAEGRIAINQNTVVDAQGRPIEGDCLTEEIDREVARLGLLDP